jgi:hypothetical protein
MLIGRGVASPGDIWRTIMAPMQFTVHDLERLLRETEQAHGEYERSLGHPDDNWPAWYASYMFSRIPPAGEFADEPERLPSAEPYLSE